VNNVPGHDAAPNAVPPRPSCVILTTDRTTGTSINALVDALHTAGIAVEQRIFISEYQEEDARGVLLLAAAEPPSLVARLVAPVTAPIGVFPALTAALGVGKCPAPAMLQLKADGVFISIRGHNVFDITQALDALPAQLARLDTRREERRLVYSEGIWRIDP